MGAQIDVVGEVATDEVPLEYLEREICQLGSNIAAATCRWLLLLAEFDRREGWAVWGARSCAEWLSWRCGIGAVAARDHLRVAQRLGELKLVRAGFAAGELSFSKVRAISRVATAETEATLVELARHATANHMEQIARAYRGLERRMAKDDKDQGDGGYLHWYWDDDGYLVIVGRFPPEEGAIFIEALNAARSALAGEPEKDEPSTDDSAESQTSVDRTDPRDSAESPTSPADHTDARDSAESQTPPEDYTDPDDSAESPTSPAGATEDSAGSPGPHDSAESRWATPEHDSAESLWTDEEEDDYVNGYWMVPEDEESGELVWVAGRMPEEDDSAQAVPTTAGDNDRGGPAARSTRDSAESRPTAADALVSMAETMLRYGPQARDGGDRYQAVVIVDAEVLAGDGPGRCEIDNGPAIPPEVARRITCDSSVIMTILGPGGEPLNIGRTSRTIPRAIRRALRIRDGKCRFPGCTQRRFVDGHHIQHWSQGGETSLENLVLLCRLHHRKVHEQNFTVRYDGGTRFTFTRPDGTPFPEAPTAVPALHGDIVRGNQELGLRIGPDTGSSLWAGEQLDLALVMDGLLALEGHNLN
ncbi:MAG TPA: DUF222 domain-containing protein [Acidimicrobiales bacterium]|nr:DUF222 domain-containing protein [Acidimicrobiales bacterium]